MPLCLCIRDKREREQAKCENSMQKELVRIRVLNTTGFPALPVELLMEIISYFPARLPFNAELARDYGHRLNPKMLMVLSQTCNSLRNICLPVLWHRIGHISARYQEILATRAPNLAQFIRIIDLRLISAKTETINKITSCLEFLPNVHTFHTTDALRANLTAIRSAFRNKVFLSIQTIIIPQRAADILESFPNARVVGLSACGGLFTWHSKQRYASALQKVFYHCPNAEELRGFEAFLYREDVLCGIVKHLRRIRHIHINVFLLTASITTDDIDSLKGLPDLEIVEFHLSTYSESRSKIQDLIQHALAVLRTSSLSSNNRQGKRVILTKHKRGEVSGKVNLYA